MSDNIWKRGPIDPGAWIIMENNYLDKIRKLEHHVLALEARIDVDRKFSDWTHQLCNSLQLELNNIKNDKNIKE